MHTYSAKRPAAASRINPRALSLALLVVALQTGCLRHPADSPPPPPPAPAKVADANAAAAQVAQEIAIEPALTNPLLQVSPADFMTVIGDCGPILLSETPQGDKAPACLLAIRERAKKQGLGEVSDVQIGHPYIAKRWRYQISQAK